MEKRCPQGLTQAEALALWRPRADRPSRPAHLDTFGGLSPLVCREAAWPTPGGTPDRQLEADQTCHTGSGNLLRKASAPGKRPYLLTQNLTASEPTPLCPCLIRAGLRPGGTHLRFPASGPVLHPAGPAGRHASKGSRCAGRCEPQDQTAGKWPSGRAGHGRDQEHLRQMGDLVTITSTPSARARPPSRRKLPTTWMKPIKSLSVPQPDVTKYYKDYAKAKGAGEKGVDPTSWGWGQAGVPPQRPGGWTRRRRRGQAGRNPAGAVTAAVTSGWRAGGR